MDSFNQSIRDYTSKKARSFIGKSKLMNLKKKMLEAKRFPPNTQNSQWDIFMSESSMYLCKKPHSCTIKRLNLCLGNCYF